METNKSTVFPLQLKVPIDLKNAFKAKCATSGVSMLDSITTYMIGVAYHSYPTKVPYNEES